MAWLQKLGDTSKRVRDAIGQTASALEVHDENFRSLATDLGRVHCRQQDVENLLCEHELALDALREEVAALKASLAPAWDPSSSSRRLDTTAVAPSDLQGFVAALPHADVDDDHIAAAVRTLVTAASYELHRDPVSPERFPWQTPLLVLASGPAERLEAFLDEVRRRSSAPALWLIGRPRDERIARELLRTRVQFVEYTASGPFSLEHCREWLPELRRVPFGAVVFLDTGLWGDRLEHCHELLKAIARDRVYCFSGDDQLYHLQDSPERTRALQFTRELLAWYDRRLVPAGEV
jgi:hypothetical protein